VEKLNPLWKPRETQIQKRLIYHQKQLASPFFKLRVPKSSGSDVPKNGMETTLPLQPLGEKSGLFK